MRHAVLLILIGTVSFGCQRDQQQAYAYPDDRVTRAMEVANPPPPSQQQRREMAQGVLGILHKNISSGQLNYRFNPSGESVALGAAGLAFLASGSTLGGGPYQKSLTAIQQRLQTIMDSERFQMQPTWGCAQATIFLAELHRTAPPKDKPVVGEYLSKYAVKLIDAQTSRGGWCHGFEDVANSLGYTDFVSTTSMAVMGLGLARREGVSVPEETIANGIGYIENSSNGGIIGYSPRSNQKGMRGPGRTAGGALALMACGQERAALAVAAGKYLEDSFQHVKVDRPQSALNSGHACAQMGVAWAAWWAGANGKYNAFWQGQGGLITGRRQADGSFVPAPTDGENTSSNSEIGDFANAWHALMLVADTGVLQIRPLSRSSNSIEGVVAVAQQLTTDWPGTGAIPSAISDLAALGNDFGKPNPKVITERLETAVESLQQSSDDAAIEIIVQLLGTSVTGTAELSSTGQRMTVEVVMNPVRMSRIVSAEVMLEPNDELYVGKLAPKKLSATTRPKSTRLLARLAEGITPPDTIPATVTWKTEDRTWQETIEIPISKD